MDSFTQSFIRFLKGLQLDLPIRQNAIQLSDLGFLKLLFVKVLHNKKVNDQDFASWESFDRYIRSLDISGVGSLLNEFEYPLIEHLKYPFTEPGLLQLEILCHILLKWIHKQGHTFPPNFPKADAYRLNDALKHVPYGEYTILKWRMNQSSRKNEDLTKTVKDIETKLQACINAKRSLEKRLKETSDINSELEREKMDLEILCDNKLKELTKLNKKYLKVVKDYEQVQRENEDLKSQKIDTKNSVSPIFEVPIVVNTPETPLQIESKTFSQTSPETATLEEEIKFLKQECNLLSRWIHEHFNDNKTR
ncbi:uncharacterized protein Ecym_5271 [Eremothecium cymbalariae DBVPG|uniref:Uncharacterized protein n=1 Tax=Eremothecium cymbalariae (strain CBS 270.75 / DBVPG 7215 / KCTC 17166 / NRRL Y-17582) TaxID=931890 RepID=I6ND93_ERECY|nr:hypothetical protein Ecym_5271 [Eremothecium cymbalariae DBVPG\